MTWVGIIVGIVGVVLTWRARRPNVVALQSHNVAMIGGGAVFPDDVEVQYRGTPVPKITSSTVWVWNAGKQTVKGSDIVAHDPLRLRFGGKVLNVRVKKVSRHVLRITAEASDEASETVSWGFEFLDPGDGGVLEVLYTGPAEPPECSGTIIGLSKGIRRYTSDPSVTATGEGRLYRFSFAVMAIMGLSMAMQELLAGC